MTNQDSSQVYENLVKKIVKAVPEIREHPSYRGEWDECTRCKVLKECWDKFPCDRPITFDDVLRSLPRIVLDQITFSMPLVGEKFRIRFKEKFADIILGKPLSEQSLETQLFLNSII